MDQGENGRKRSRGRAWLMGWLALGTSVGAHAAVYELAIRVGHPPIVEVPEHRPVEFTVVEPEPIPPPPVATTPPPPPEPPPRPARRPPRATNAPEVDTAVEGDGDGIGGALRWQRFRIYGESLRVDAEVSGEVPPSTEPATEAGEGLVTGEATTAAPAEALATPSTTPSTATPAPEVTPTPPATAEEPALERALLAVTFEGSRLAASTSADGRVARGIARTLGLDSVLEGSGIDLASEVERILLLSTDPTDPVRLVVVARLSPTAEDLRARLGVDTTAPSVGPTPVVRRWPGTNEARVVAFVGTRDLVVCLRRDLVAVLGLLQSGSGGTSLLDAPADDAAEILHADVTPTPSDDGTAPRLPVRLGLRPVEGGGLSVEVRVVGGAAHDADTLLADDGPLGSSSSVAHLGLSPDVRTATAVVDGSDRVFRVTLAPERASALADSFEPPSP